MSIWTIRGMDYNTSMEKTTFDNAKTVLTKAQMLLSEYFVDCNSFATFNWFFGIQNGSTNNKIISSR